MIQRLEAKRLRPTTLLAARLAAFKLVAPQTCQVGDASSPGFPKETVPNTGRKAGLGHQSVFGVWIGPRRELKRSFRCIPGVGLCTMSGQERPRNHKGSGLGKDSPPGQEARTDTGSYANQDLVAMMRRRRGAEEKLRQRQEDVVSLSDDEQGR